MSKQGVCNVVSRCAAATAMVLVLSLSLLPTAPAAAMSGTVKPAKTASDSTKEAVACK